MIRYLDKVKIKAGFYKGLKGMIVNELKKPQIETSYEVELKPFTDKHSVVKGKVVTVVRHNLEKI